MLYSILFKQLFHRRRFHRVAQHSHRLHKLVECCRRPLASTQLTTTPNHPRSTKIKPTRNTKRHAEIIGETRRPSKHRRLQRQLHIQRMNQQRRAGACHADACTCIRPCHWNSRHHQIIQARSKPHHRPKAINQHKRISLIHEPFLLVSLASSLSRHACSVHARSDQALPCPTRPDPTRATDDCQFGDRRSLLDMVLI